MCASPIADLRSVRQLMRDTVLDEKLALIDLRSAGKPETGRYHSGFSDFSFRVISVRQRLY